MGEMSANGQYRVLVLICALFLLLWHFRKKKTECDVSGVCCQPGERGEEKGDASPSDV